MDYILVRHQIIRFLRGHTSFTHSQVPSCLPISESENQNTDQLVLHGHGPITQIPDLSKRLLITGYHTGTGQISPLPKTVFLAGNRQEQ